MDLKLENKDLFQILQCLLSNVDGYLDMRLEDRNDENTYGLIHYAQKRLTTVVKTMEEDIKSDALNDKQSVF